MLKNMSALNLQRLIGQLVHPDRHITPALNSLAQHALDEIGAKPAATKAMHRVAKA
jgi:hypothetical protein